MKLTLQEKLLRRSKKIPKSIFGIDIIKQDIIENSCVYLSGTKITNLALKINNKFKPIKMVYNLEVYVLEKNYKIIIRSDIKDNTFGVVIGNGKTIKEVVYNTSLLMGHFGIDIWKQL